RKLAASRLDLAVGRDVLARKLPLVVHADAASDIQRVIELAQRLSLNVVIASGAEAWKQAKQLAAAKIPVIVDPLNNLPASFASRGARADSAKLLTDAGVRVAFSTFESHNVRKLRQAAGNAVRAGLSHDRALEAVTLAPAQIFGQDRSVGRVEPGKVANLVLWSGDPFELSTRVVAVFIRGRKMALTSRQTRLFERYR
ncbi:MAG TPA: amidohydrolase family protein, partial [Polyangiaceae bacterium]|nr:amidohydrolase family protein [Polyangiaceae bacterium]